MQKKNIALCILLSLLTCGIYYLIWINQLEDDTSYLTQDQSTFESTNVGILTLVTCGIYGIYWLYKVGKERMPIISGEDKSTLYLLLSVFGLQLVAVAIMQSDVNTMIERGN